MAYSQMYASPGVRARTVRTIRWPRVIALVWIAFVASTTVIAWLGEMTSTGVWPHTRF